MKIGEVRLVNDKNQELQRTIDKLEDLNKQLKEQILLSSSGGNQPSTGFNRFKGIIKPSAISRQAIRPQQNNAQIQESQTDTS